MSRTSERWVLDMYECSASICLPADLNTADLISIETLGDRWMKYLDRRTGKVHDCAEYYKQMLKEM